MAVDATGMLCTSCHAGYPQGRPHALAEKVKGFIIDLRLRMSREQGFKIKALVQPLSSYAGLTGQFNVIFFTIAQ